MPSEKRNIASIAEREMPLENWEELEVQLEFPEQEAAARPPLIRSAEAEKLRVRAFAGVSSKGTLQ